MKIGIYMAYGPATVLGKEGLGRYIGNLIKGFIELGHQVTVACPQWSMETIDDLFQDFRIDAEKVEFVVSYKTPALWRLYESKYKKRHPKSSLKYKIFSSFLDIVEYLLNKVLYISSMGLFIGITLLIGIMSLFVGILLLPVAIIGLIGVLVAKVIKKIIYKSEFHIKKSTQKGVSRLKHYTKARWMNFRSTLIERRDSVVGQALVEKINLKVDGVDIWFVPALFWPEITGLKARKVICAPDIVTIEFPMQFSLMNMISNTKRCQHVLQQEEYFITYCNYVREALLLERYNKDERKVKVIPHINNEMQAYVSVDTDKKRLNTNKDLSSAFARAVLCVAKYRFLVSPSAYMTNFQVEDTKYIFYASQIRPHKNILTLIRAYEYLLRERYCKVKLILTGDYTTEYYEQIYTYVKEHRLEYDILSFYNVTAQELAALYKCAELVVNPTLYEGGFPFTFGEGMSVGTPSVMSDIPQVREVVEPYGLADQMLFNPYDYRAMAAKIEYGLKHKRELYNRQLPLYREMEKRTASVVAAEYVAAFQSFIQQEKEQKYA